jgi:uncharacterized membrane protein
MVRTSGRAGRMMMPLAVPLLYAVAAIILGMTVPRLEARYFPELTGANTAGAFAVLSAIASGTLPLTGLVFSLAFVMVQFSATAYSPRLVSWLAASSVMVHSLGVFIATFLYALVALAWVDRGGSGRVPLVTVSVALGLLFVSVVFFVALVGRLGSLQITRVLAYVGDQGRAVIEAYPPSTGDDPAEDAFGQLPPVSQVLTYRGGPVAVQAIHLRRLTLLAVAHRTVVTMAAAVGDTVVDGTPLLQVHGGNRPIREWTLRRCVQLGRDRTFEQDPKYAIRLLVDVAIRALSPAVNDPTTAVQALDQIEDLLIRLGKRRLSFGRVRDSKGDARVFYPVPSWDDFVVLAFDEIRYYGATSIQVMRRLRALIRTVMEHVPVARRPALQRYLTRVDAGIVRAFEDDDDRRDALVEDRQGLGMPQDSRKA